MPALQNTDARRKRLALLAAIMGSFVAGLDATAVNVALPAMTSAAALRASSGYRGGSSSGTKSHAKRPRRGSLA